MSEKDPQLSVITDPITGQVSVVRPEQRAAYERVRMSVMDQFRPEGFMETMMANHIVQDLWMIESIRELMRRSGETAWYRTLTLKLDLVERHSKQLNKMQSTRREERDKILDQAALLAQLNFAKGQTYNPDFDFPPENGFVFSIEEIKARIHRNERLAEARREARRRKPRAA